MFRQDVVSGRYVISDAMYIYIYLAQPDDYLSYKKNFKKLLQKLLNP